MLILFSYNFIGAGFVYNFWLWSIREGVEEKLEKEYEDEETLIRVPLEWADNPPEEFKWHDDHEFQYRGEMYDIIRKEVHDDEMWYYCHHDRAETELLNKLSAYVSNYLQQDPKERQNKLLLKILWDKTFFPSHANILSGPVVKSPFASFQQRTTSGIFWNIDPPPPKITSAG